MMTMTDMPCPGIQDNRILEYTHSYINWTYDYDMTQPCHTVNMISFIITLLKISEVANQIHTITQNDFFRNFNTSRNIVIESLLN